MLLSNELSTTGLHNPRTWELRGIIMNENMVSILNFGLVVCNAFLKQQGQVAVSQKLLSSKAVFVAVLQYSHWKIQENHCLWMKRTSQQLTISIGVPRMVWLNYLQKKNLGEVSLLLWTRKFVEEMKQEYRSTARSQCPEVFENDISQM